MNIKLSQLIFQPLKRAAISRETGLNSSKKKIKLCFIACCLMSCILLFLFQYVSGSQKNTGSRLPVKTLSQIQLFSGPSGNVRDNSVPGRHIFCEADLTRMQPENHEFQDGQLWGKIVDSPLLPKELFRVRDLVYIRCCKEKHEFVREGDRFEILAHPSLHSQLNINQDRPEPESKIVGEIEITSVGSDLVLGIIIDCRAEILRGYRIVRFSRIGVEQRNSLDSGRLNIPVQADKADLFHS
jgi:hypothetical protein